MHCHILILILAGRDALKSIDIEIVRGSTVEGCHSVGLNNSLVLVYYR